MNINCPQKLLKAMCFAQEKDNNTLEYFKEKIRDVYDMLNDPQHDKEEIEKTLNKIYSQLQPNVFLTSSLMGALERIVRYEANCRERGDWDTEYSISTDFGDHCFFFKEHNPSKQTDWQFCGGIIYHGCPEDGYMTNGSVMIDPQYGWQIHT